MERYVGDMWPKSFSARMTYLASFSVKLAMCLLEASVSAKSMCRVWNSAIEGMPKRLRRSMLRAAASSDSAQKAVRSGFHPARQPRKRPGRPHTWPGPTEHET
eukprot:scaffold1572_cov329-Prasinococcus_capsulatus_cf.AAC.6